MNKSCHSDSLNFSHHLVMQFVDSQEYSKFTRIVFDTTPTVSTYIIKADCSLIDIHLPNCKHLIGTYSASFNTARLSGCFFWEDDEEMGWIGEQVDSVKSIQFIKFATQTISLGMIVTLALIIWKGLMCVTGGESPVVVLSGSMEPGFKRGDILFLHMSKDPIRA
ncbi:uncharacterized protein LOC108196231 isoform X3 [Daucus carota subsp. sativus]|uniref:uncharacterized protein LOC108196231 isoform X3 n=1 Tax=Daucus carota subsp. sativus TaxID=79200 RepID=UPI0030839710